MASAFSHALVSITAQRLYPDAISITRLWFIAIACSILPDIDVIGFFFGIPYSAPWGHRGMTHSLFFAFCTALVISMILLRDEKFYSPIGLFRISLLFLVTASHGVLDAMTNGGLGIAFFAPFDNTRYFLPIQPIQVSPIGVKSFFSEWGLRVILSEIIWIGLPCLFLLVSHKLVARNKS